MRDLEGKGMSWCYRVAACMILLVSQALPTLAQPVITALRTNEGITVDGILSERTWQRPGFDGFHQRDHGGVERWDQISSGNS